MCTKMDCIFFVLQHYTQYASLHIHSCFFFLKLSESIQIVNCISKLKNKLKDSNSIKKREKMKKKFQGGELCENSPSVMTAQQKI